MNTRLLTMALVGILSLTGIESASAQTGDDALRIAQRLPLASAQLAGSAGVGVAGRGDLGDLFLNPAGLGLMKRGAFSIGLNTSNVQDDAIYSIGGSSAVASTSDLTQTRLGNISYAYRFPTSQGALVIAAGLSQVASFQRSLSFEGDNGLNSITDYLMPIPGEFELMEDADGVFPEFTRPLSFIGFETFAIDLDPDASAAGAANPFLPAVSRGTILQSGLVTEEGYQSEFAVGGSVEAAEGVLVGVSLNVPFGRYRFNRVLNEDDVRDDNNGTGGTTDFDFLTFGQSFESRMVGVNLRAGVSALVGSNLRFGVSVETPTYYTVSEDYDTNLVTGFDNGDSFEYGFSADQDAGRGSFEYEIRTPWKLATGLSFDTGKLSLSGDLELIDWSQLELDSRDFAFTDENLAIRQELNARVNLRLGAGYRFEKLTLRGGLAVTPDPRANSVGPNRDRGIVSLGASYQVNSQFAFDLGLMAEVFDDQYRPYTEVADAPIVNEEVVRSFFSLGVRVGL
jgi:outer membrane protein transport protein (OMPP1/FadL/TodX)